MHLQYFVFEITYYDNTFSCDYVVYWSSVVIVVFQYEYVSLWLITFYNVLTGIRPQVQSYNWQGNYTFHKFSSGPRARRDPNAARCSRSRGPPHHSTYCITWHLIWTAHAQWGGHVTWRVPAQTNPNKLIIHIDDSQQFGFNYSINPIRIEITYLTSNANLPVTIISALMQPTIFINLIDFNAYFLTSL